MSARLFRLFGSLALLGVVLWWSAAGEVWERLREAQPFWIVIAILALNCSTLSMARRWQLTARALELKMTFRAALKEYYLALLANSLLPGGVVGDVSRAIRTRQHGDLKRAAQSVVAERLMGQVALFAVLFAGLSVSLLWPGGIEWPSGTGWMLGAGVALSFGVLIWLASAQKTARFTKFCLVLMVRPEISAHAMTAAALLIFGLYACARATGTELSIEASVTVLPLVLCAMLVPLSIAGWGWREGAAAALFPILGASPEAGIAMGICYGAVMLLAALPAVAFVFMLSEAELNTNPLENAS
ncbi:lysylphosphatidylglycerol synthase transmembrane domain-containing protein [Ruegeria lacuscaerulensis]|uniref:lysylphosphatidylglycerol synthase transmembrane domain-containing protein n=1 Tax=Ruegeria lacuscaerulensis TaxID=55218 RepID=UPI00147B6AD3|nr:lysylphosphatidylglycerol synthase transmembrane domain-containing protein [Ruegeria lacuscaerulensis]